MAHSHFSTCHHRLTGVLLLLVTGFFESFRKVTVTGIGEIDIATAGQLAGKVAEVTGGDAERPPSFNRKSLRWAARPVGRHAGRLSLDPGEQHSDAVMVANRTGAPHLEQPGQA